MLFVSSTLTKLSPKWSDNVMECHGRAVCPKNVEIERMLFGKKDFVGNCSVPLLQFPFPILSATHCNGSCSKVQVQRHMPLNCIHCACIFHFSLFVSMPFQHDRMKKEKGCVFLLSVSNIMDDTALEKLKFSYVILESVFNDGLRNMKKQQQQRGGKCPGAKPSGNGGRLSGSREGSFILTVPECKRIFLATDGSF